MTLGHISICQLGRWMACIDDAQEEIGYVIFIPHWGNVKERADGKVGREKKTISLQTKEKLLAVDKNKSKDSLM